MILLDFLAPQKKRELMIDKQNKALKINSKIKGAFKENIVVQHLKNKGWTILYKNKKIFGVEIDILAKKEKEIFLIEVKSLKREDHLEKILRSKQKERLKKAAQSLCEDFPKGLRLFLATVNSKNKIDFLKVLINKG